MKTKNLFQTMILALLIFVEAFSIQPTAAKTVSKIALQNSISASTISTVSLGGAKPASITLPSTYYLPFGSEVSIRVSRTGYLYKDALQSALGMTTAANKPAAAAKPAPAAEVAKPATPEPAKPVVTAAAEPAPKFTQRLNADGTEVDAGPGTKPAEVGEGSTVAAATTPSTETPATPAEPAKPVETVAVGQKAIFYEEKTGTEAGTADQGAVVWSVVQDSCRNVAAHFWVLPCIIFVLTF